ncbi:MAG: histidine kinase [Pseudomonadota bacterium]
MANKALILLISGCALAIVGLAFGLYSGSSPIEALLPVIGFALVFGAAASVSLRDSRRPLDRLMFALALMYLLQTLVQSSNPYLFTIGRAARPLIEALLIWVMLSFPTGLLNDRRARAVVFIALVVLPLLWLLGLTTSSAIPMGGRFVTCSVDCPRNVLFITDHPAISHAAFLAFRLLGVMTAIAAALLLMQRLSKATPLMRHTLAPVLFASICRTLSVAAFLLFGYGPIALTVTLWLVPASIVLGLLRGRLYMASALQKLVTGLSTRPNTAQLRDVMAQALSDPSLTIAYRSRDQWVDARGNATYLSAESANDSRRVTLVHDASGQPVAALSHDIGIDDEPMLVEAVASAMQVALESHRSEIELASTRTQAAAEERRRIERDLHDGAQQRLIALRMKLSVTQRILEKDHRRARILLSELDADVVATLRDVRELAHGQTPIALADLGLSAALKQIAHESGKKVTLEIDDLPALSPKVEHALYFCASEALQNAAKHAHGTDPVKLSLMCKAGDIQLRIENACTETMPDSIQGHGLNNMQERIRAIDGSCSCGFQLGNIFVVDISIPR